MIEYIIIGLLVLTLIVLVALLFKKGNQSSNSKGDNSDLIKELSDFKEKINAKLTENKIESINSNNIFRMELNKDINKFKDDMKSDFDTIGRRFNDNIVNLNEKVETRLKGGFETTNKTFEEIKDRVTKIDVAQKNIETLSSQVVSLQNVLTNNQARGQFGEYQLNNLLESLYGENKKLYDTQYTLRNGSRADAVIYLQEPFRMVCIDSKFSYSSFKRVIDVNLTDDEEKVILVQLRNDLKKHIKDIATKYIIEGETAPFAWMFIPSDALLSLIHYKMSDIIKFANDLQVSIVSPTLLLPLLTSYKVLNINLEQTKNAALIKEQLRSLDVEISGLKERWEKLYRNLNTATNSAEEVNIKVNKITRKFNDIKNREEE